MLRLSSFEGVRAVVYATTTRQTSLRTGLAFVDKYPSIIIFLNPSPTLLDYRQGDQ
jgi:hypothetical protein